MEEHRERRRHVAECRRVRLCEPHGHAGGPAFNHIRRTGQGLRATCKNFA